MSPYWIISKIELNIFNYRIRGVIIKVQTAVNPHICLIQTNVWEGGMPCIKPYPFSQLLAAAIRKKE